jgi:hypothetical protein
LQRLLLKLSYFQSREDRGHLIKALVVVEKVEVMVDGNLGDEAIDGTSNGNDMPTIL